MSFLNRFVVGASIGSVVWMTAMWAQAAEEKGTSVHSKANQAQLDQASERASATSKGTVWAAVAPHKQCQIVYLNGDAIISCKKDPIVCRYINLTNGRPNEKVLVCEGGLPNVK